MSENNIDRTAADNRGAENQQHFSESLRRDLVRANKLRDDIDEALVLLGSTSEIDQKRLIEEVLPDLSERLGLQLDPTQNTWEFLTDQKVEIEKEIERINSWLR